MRRFPGYLVDRSARTLPPEPTRSQSLISYTAGLTSIGLAFLNVLAISGLIPAGGRMFVHKGQISVYSSNTGLLIGVRPGWWTPEEPYWGAVLAGGLLAVVGIVLSGTSRRALWSIAGLALHATLLIVGVLLEATDSY